MVSYSSSSKSAPKRSLKSAIGVSASTAYWPSACAAISACGVLGLVVLVVDLADDLLQHVLDRHQSGDAAVLVDHDRHVVARLAELAQQHVEFLGFRDQHRRTQQFAHVLRRAVVGDDAAQQVLGQQDAEDLVAVLAVHREARVAGLDHLLISVRNALVGAAARPSARAGS